METTVDNTPIGDAPPSETIDELIAEVEESLEGDDDAGDEDDEDDCVDQLED